MKKHILRIVFILLSIIFIIPSIIYLVQNATVMGFDTYYNFFIDDGTFKELAAVVYLIIIALMFLIYFLFIKRSEDFKNIKQILIYAGIIGAIFVIMLPWTSSDIFYYMGVGELNSVYGQNPYYISVKDYYEENEENIEDDILEQASSGYWSDTTVVYGPIAQIIFSAITKISFKNINVCLLLFKMLNLVAHILNCYLIYKLTRKKKFAIIYGLNPLILLEFIGNVHNDIIVVTFILFALYFLIKKKQIMPSIIFLALATGMKYFAILLLPIVVLYHFRSEEKLSKRFFKCIQYGLIFLVLIGLEYIAFLRDVDVFSAVIAQNDKLSKSIYSSIYVIILKFTESFNMDYITKPVLFAFAIIYFKCCIDLLTTKKIKFIKQIRKYNSILLLFLLCLTTFQQWYLIWLFATIMWQKPKTIKSTIYLTFATEIANCVYMFTVESYKYDPIFVYITIFVFLVLKLFNEIKSRSRKKKKIKLLNA